MATQPTSMSGRDWAILLALSVLWGGSFFFIEIAVESVAPFSLVLARLVLAGAVLWGVLLAKRERLPLPPGAASAFLILALLNNVVPFILFAWAQGTITGGLGSILNATTPIWGVIVAHIATTDERATPGKVAGVVLGFGGVAVMIGPSLLGQIGSDALAQLACLGATLCYALAGVYARRFRPMGIAPISVATGQLTAGAIVMLPLVLFFEPPWTSPAPPPEAWVALVALAIFCTSLAYILYFRLLASAGATNSLLVTFLIPISAILLGALFLGERLEPRQFAGMALIGLGLAAIDGRLLRLLRRERPAAV
ncbi:DMT family transporter [Sphingosinicella sp. LHD-64]|uniref:DMT family transporter n=1 Tax=Sphingosinicella sp. LHD-64 TaxID=3072139 RepID=UPI00281028C8|nr:DMT family transporter [Sphingosinicella sp. LHD-64]MDQ8755844.1 DMT family transporter [Sphingosinicella sp. LHD-64]